MNQTRHIMDYVIVNRYGGRETLHPEDYQGDIEYIVSKRYDNGGDFWASADGKLAVGNPFSTLECLLMLHELGCDPSHPVFKGALELVFNAWREDGRFTLAPSGTLYPCYTAHTARILCELGYAEDNRVQKSLQHLLDNQYDDGGWRCRKFPYGKGPETAFSNPWPTLETLSAFRFSKVIHHDQRLDQAVEFLLCHWETRLPIGPCHYGIGTRFMKVTYPLNSYNLFYYVYVLSFYAAARRDNRFIQALRVLQTKLDNNGRVVVEYPNRRLAGLSFCRKGCPSELATRRYQEILENCEP